MIILLDRYWFQCAMASTVPIYGIHDDFSYFLPFAFGLDSLILFLCGKQGYIRDNSIYVYIYIASENGIATHLQRNYAIVLVISIWMFICIYCMYIHRKSLLSYTNVYIIIIIRISIYIILFYIMNNRKCVGLRLVPVYRSM